MSSVAARTQSVPSAHIELDGRSTPRFYHIYLKPFHRHYEVRTTNGQSLYYGEVSLFTRNKPDVTLHAGTSRKGPVVAASKFLKFSGDFKLALGDPNDVAHVRWEDMTKESVLHSQYRWEMTVPSRQEYPHRERRSFCWKRTHHVKVDDAKPVIWSPQNYKLVDELTGEVLAVFTREWSLSKCGTLQIDADVGTSFDIMAILSYLSLYEKERRRD